MPRVSRVMIGYGAVMIVFAIISWTIADAAFRSSLAVGLAMIGAGAAAAQGRTSLRRTGLFLGMFLPVIASAFYGWRAFEWWMTPEQAAYPAVLLTCMSAVSLLTLLTLTKVRSSDNIAERGYSILPVSPTPAELKQEQQAEHP